MSARPQSQFIGNKFRHPSTLPHLCIRPVARPRRNLHLRLRTRPSITRNSLRDSRRRRNQQPHRNRTYSKPPQMLSPQNCGGRTQPQSLLHFFLACASPWTRESCISRLQAGVNRRPIILLGAKTITPIRENSREPGSGTAAPVVVVPTGVTVPARPVLRKQ